MEQTQVLASRWALLVDPAAAHSVIERMSKLELPRRVCRPLDRGGKPQKNAELERFDADIEAAVEADTSGEQEWAASEAAIEDEAEVEQEWAAIEAELEAEVEVETEIDQGWVTFERSLSES